MTTKTTEQEKTTAQIQADDVAMFNSIAIEAEATGEPIDAPGSLAVDEVNGAQVETTATGDDGTQVPADDKLTAAPPKESLATPAEDKLTTDQKVIAEYRSRTENLESQLHKLKSEEGRVSAQERQINELKARLAGLQSNPPAPASVPVVEAQPAVNSNIKVDAFKEDYGDLADGMQAMIDAKGGSSISKEDVANIVRENLAASQANQAQVVDQQAIAQMVTNEVIETSVPGWQNDVRSPEFSVWLKSQSDDISGLASSDSPADVVRLVSEFRKPPVVPATSPTVDAPTVNPRLANAAMPTNQSIRQHNAAIKPESEMTAKEHYEHIARERELEQQ